MCFFFFCDACANVSKEIAIKNVGKEKNVPPPVLREDDSEGTSGKKQFRKVCYKASIVLSFRKRVGASSEF